MKKRPNWQIVWHAMQMGAGVELHGLTYTLDENDTLCVRVDVYHNGKLDQKPEVQYLVSDMPLNTFVKECERLSDEEINNYVASAVVTTANQKNRGE